MTEEEKSRLKKLKENRRPVKKSKYKQGIYEPVNKDKYMGDVEKIVYRSSWELRFLRYLDNNPNVIRYSSEEVIIPYYNRLDKKMHRYFPDFYMEVMTETGLKKYIVEIKPEVQKNQPIKKGRVSKRFVRETILFEINSAKWEAADKFCKDNGIEFIILTEKDLGIK
jgi:hypothetical protein